MATEAKKSEPDKALGHVNGRRAQSRSIPVDWEAFARDFVHPLRVSVLDVLGIDGGRVLSPTDLSHELQVPLSNVNYHVRELAKSGWIVMVGQRAVRGATEHFYSLPEASPAEAGGRRSGGPG